MRTLSPAERRALRARAHHLHPVASIGQHGLTPAVLREIDVGLRAHELLKIRVASDDRSVRETLFAQICVELDAAPVQHLGKVLIVWRPAPEPEFAPPTTASARSGRANAGKAARAAKRPKRGAVAVSAERPPPRTGSRRRRGASASAVTAPRTQGPSARRRRTPR